MTTTVYRTYKYRLLPSRQQHKALREICESQRQLYNAALQERIGCYDKTGKGRSYEDQCKALTELRQDPDFSALPALLQRWTLRRLDEAFKAFLSRVKRGETPGFPRFRASGRWDSFGFNQCYGGIRFDGKRIRFKGLQGSLRVHIHRPLPEGAELKSCVFRRDPKGWYVCLQCAVPMTEITHEGPEIGVHIGAENFATLSTGEAIPNPQIARKAAREMRRRRRAWKRCRKGSRRCRKVMAQVTRLQEKIGNTRRTFLHQQSARLARQYSLIGVEDMKNINQSPMGISDAAWGNFINMLTYKAESAGGEVIRVKLGNTSAACASCGAIVSDLNAGILHCGHCGTVMDRDRNAAVNILALAVTGRGQVNAADSRKRSAENLDAETEQS